MCTRWLIAFALLSISARASAAVLFQPDGASATSEFSVPYSIENAINGSGMPPGFDETSTHAFYQTGNHWTTAANQVPGVSATFDFDDDVTIGTFYLWNHQSNSIASNVNYEVTLFDLILRDAANATLLSLPSLAAVGESSSAQAYAFVPVSGVRSVEFIVRENQGLGVNNPNYTGLAEVAFSSMGVPEPSAWALAALTLVGGRLRRVTPHS
jgi:hypothetical protein